MANPKPMVVEVVHENMETNSSLMTAKHGLGEDEIEEVEHPRLGLLKIQAWHEFHFRQAAEAKLSLIRVEQLDSPKSKPLWLAWHGEQMPTLIELVKLYLRRFTIEHW